MYSMKREWEMESQQVQRKKPGVSLGPRAKDA